MLAGVDGRGAIAEAVAEGEEEAAASIIDAAGFATRFVTLQLTTGRLSDVKHSACETNRRPRTVRAQKLNLLCRTLVSTAPKLYQRSIPSVGHRSAAPKSASRRRTLGKPSPTTRSVQAVQDNAQTAF